LASPSSFFDLATSSAFASFDCASPSWVAASTASCTAVIRQLSDANVGPDGTPSHVVGGSVVVVVVVVVGVAAEQWSNWR
jgi:hypothetical protein